MKEKLLREKADKKQKIKAPRNRTSAWLVARIQKLKLKRGKPLVACVGFFEGN